MELLARMERVEGVSDAGHQVRAERGLGAKPHADAELQRNLLDLPGGEIEDLELEVLQARAGGSAELRLDLDVRDGGAVVPGHSLDVPHRGERVLQVEIRAVLRPHAEIGYGGGVVPRVADEIDQDVVL